ncbi:ATP-binding protein [Roseateles oligotrophus]|uniref:histidine kinase n=1 Tax=Roseateles oligotrophus TaxID=1769250 RepID=A0ABT2YCV2_9BURK|nr:ATP-binding protein [Roseateles oligotrophus]MCV2367867.1 sensor histidine kinase N-terminal domain-containing protein [Roseateles oligotrophus]
MKLRQPASLQGRLVALVLSLVLLIWLGLSAAVWVDARHELDELLDGHLAQAAALLVAQQQGEGQHDEQAIDAPTLHRYANKVAFQVFHEGQLQQRSANAPALPMIAFDEGFRQGLRSTMIEGKRWRVFAAFGAERDVQVYVGEQVESRLSILWAVLRAVLWPLILALPLLALVVWWAVWRGTMPLRELGRQLADRSALDLAVLNLTDAPSEMAPMLTAMNGLFERIGAMMQAERRFTADAAHELRTPIAAIRTQAQVALAEPDAELRRHALQATLLGCERASRLVDQLLTLARLEGGERPACLPLDLSAWLRQLLAELAPAALQRRQDLSLEILAEPAPEIVANEPLLRAMLRNLIDNALRYSPVGARIEVTLQAQADRVLLQVADSGPGLTDAELQRLGERFYRVLGSEASGSGLGWSILRRIAELHGATLQARRSERLGGLEVRVGFPARPQQSA